MHQDKRNFASFAQARSRRRQRVFGDTNKPTDAQRRILRRAQVVWPHHGGKE